MTLGASTMSAFVFQKEQPRPWHGRYRRIPGKESVLHVRWDGQVQLIWRDGLYTWICPAIMTRDVISLGKAVNEVKRRYAGQPGGAFVINEYGQVITPVPDTRPRRFYIGYSSGSIVFIGPSGKRFTLDDDAGLCPGDDWMLPYVGIAYCLSWNNRIYFPMREGIDTECQYPPRQDPNLIRAIRRIRPFGGVRFIVNPHGIVLTKVEVTPSKWQPKYAGRINYQCWFPRENI